MSRAGVAHMEIEFTIYKHLPSSSITHTHIEHLLFFVCILLRMEQVNVNSRVKVQSKLTVVSSKPTRPGNKVLSFTSLDHAMGLHSARMVFYYKANPFKDGPMKCDLDNLRVRLSDLLCSYPKLTGRVDGNLELKCNDAGVRMLRASVGTTIDEWLRSADASHERDLTVWEDMHRDPTTWSPFRIQMNDFEGGGLAIGLSFSHMLADLTAATLFFKSWADFHCGETLAHTPVFELPAACSKRPSPNLTHKTIQQTPLKKMSSATFRFPSSKMKERLSKIHATYSTNATPFDLLTALFWWRIAHLKPTPNKQSLSICIDLRKHKKEPIIPREYFGNALHFSLLKGHEKLESCELEHVVRLVHNHMEGIEEEDDLLSSTLDWLESLKGDKSEPLNMYGSELTCVSLDDCPDLNIYRTMFKKDDRPLHVSYHVDNVGSEGLIMVMPSPEEGLGRTVTVTLPEEHIASLFQDKAILEMEPEMLFYERKYN